MITVIPLYQAYPPFNEVFPKLCDDLEKQTVDHVVIVSEQEAIGFINLGILYDQKVDEVETEHILFTGVDAKFPSNLLESLERELENADIVFTTIQKRSNWKKTAEGIFALRKDLWADFRKSEYYELFLSILGIPAATSAFLRYAMEKLNVHYMLEPSIGLRLDGCNYRKHQMHYHRHKARRMNKAFSQKYNFVINWIHNGTEWIPSKGRPKPNG